MSERNRDSAARLCSLSSASIADFLERYGIHTEKLQPWQRELIAEVRDFKPTTAGVSRSAQKRERAALLSFLRESLGLFVCCRCGETFQSLPPPADTRPDDPNPMCNDCLERELDEVEPEPMSQEEIDSIVSRVTGRGTLREVLMSYAEEVFPRYIPGCVTMSEKDALEFMGDSEQRAATDPATGVTVVFYRKDGKVLVREISRDPV